MNHPFIYVGCFVKLGDLHSAISPIRRDPLENDIQDPHITFAYKPKEVDQSLFGKSIRIKAVGYGNDGQNEGLKVQLESDDPSIQAMVAQIEIPHITISVSPEGRPVNTKNLDFTAIHAIELEGTYGGYAKWGEVIVRARRN